jgi:hypothetical protein
MRDRYLAATAVRNAIDGKYCTRSPNLNNMTAQVGFNLCWWWGGETHGNNGQQLNGDGYLQMGQFAKSGGRVKNACL